MTNDLHPGNKAAWYLLLAYCLFILYGTFIPFHFNLDPNFVRWRWEAFLIEPVRGGIPRPSLSDVLSNILLFVPFGMLCTWLRTASAGRGRALASILLTGVYGLLFGIAIESGQTLAPWRSPSPVDALCNGIGAFSGAVAGLLLVRAFRGSCQTRFVRVVRYQPSSLLLGYLLLGVFLDSYYPFDVTLDPSTIWHNLKQSEIIPFQSGLHRYWFQILTEKGAVYVAIGYLVLTNLRRRWHDTGAAPAWLVCSVLAAAIEVGKLFFSGRAFYSTNIILASTGALLGVSLLPGLSALMPLKRHRKSIWLVLALGFLLYFELSPFDWVSPRELPARFSRIEWLPFQAYYSAEPLAALFDLQQKIYFLIPLGYLVMSQEWIRRSTEPRYRALSVCILIAAALEFFQTAVRSRIPSSTDVIIFSASAWIGIVIFQLVQSIREQQ